MNNEQQQIIDEAYKNYCKSFENQSIIEQNSYDTEPITKQMFIDKVKNLDWFSEKWGLKIEERELSLEERYKLDHHFDCLIGEYPEHHITLDERGVPCKLITITYKEQTIKSYE